MASLHAKAGGFEDLAERPGATAETLHDYFAASGTSFGHELVKRGCLRCVGVE